MPTLPFATVTSENELNQDLAAIAGFTGSYIVTFGKGFTLDTDLLALNLAKGGSLTLQGAGTTIDGANRFRGLFDYSGTLTVNDLTIANARVSGGHGGQGSTNGGGGGGGGAGLGGGLFVAAAGNTTLNNVTFSNDSAVGGNGGNAAGPSSLADGGGGGLGGNGGNGQQRSVGGGLEPFGGSGGGIGVGAIGGSLAPGGPGLIPTNPTARIGGGGGTGSGVNDYSPSGGGVSPGGSPGGFGGGGGGGQNGGGANGGFGGGGAGGGSGGFGGGGGGDTVTRAGGFGAGSGGSRETKSDFFPGGGGGGLGAGGDIFVAQGGELSIGIVGLNAGLVAGGAAGSQSAGISPGTTSPTAGQAFGNGIFIEGNQSVKFTPPAGETVTINSIIADMNGSTAQSGGAGSVIMNGEGTLKLGVAEPYTGGTRIGNGTLELANANAAGTGHIGFGGTAHGGPAVLRIDTLAAPVNMITGLGTGDTIDLAALPYVSGATARIINTKLTVISGGQTVTLNALSPNAALATEKDASGGTDVHLFFPVVRNEQELNNDLLTIAGSTTAQKITIGGSFPLIGPLYAVNLGAGGSLTLDGGGFALNGRGIGVHRGIIVYSGTVTIRNLGLNNMVAMGGAGGKAANPGGGGGGLGGGLFVASQGNVTLDNVTFSGDAAIGGQGGNYLGVGFAAGGGGGLGGPGGGGLPDGLDFTYDGGGGGVGTPAGGGAFGTRDGQGGIGIVPRAASGGSGGQGVLGGVDGGGGGNAARGDGGGGGVGGQAGNSAGNFGGNGGFGGGGGGGGSGFFNSTNGGGSGGFGGGAGGAANDTHTGGFGGGGGGGGDKPGVAGFGGGSGGGSNFGGGGGGGGFGGDIFVQEGGSLIIKGGTLGEGTVTGGAGGAGRTPPANSGKPGVAGGGTIFEQGKQAITFAPDSGETLTVHGVIADESSLSPGAGAGRVVVKGAGIVDLAGSNTYTGGTTLQSGTLELVTPGSAGTGPIAFDASTSATETLRLDYVRPGATTVHQVIHQLGAGASRIYLPNVSLKGITFDSDTGNRLVFEAGGTTYTFGHIDEVAGETINATSLMADTSGKGVDIIAVPMAGGIPSAAGDIVRVSGGSTAAALHGGDDMAFLGGGAGPVNTNIVEQVSGLAADPINNVADVYRVIGSDTSMVSDLLPGSAGNTNAAGVSFDGAGDSFAALGGGRSVDVPDLPQSVLQFGNEGVII